MDSAPLADANLTGANLTNADLFRATLANANLTEANLTNANLYASTLTNADLTGANLRNALLDRATGLKSAKFSAGSVFNQWTVFPASFSPTAAGLTMAMSTTGDLDANDTLDAADVDVLANRIGGRKFQPWWLRDVAFDMNGDSSIDLEDHRVWVKDIKHTWFGDADLDGEFNSDDFVQAFQAGKYERAGWMDGTTQVKPPAGPKATGTATASLAATTSSPPSRMAATNRDRGRM